MKKFRWPVAVLAFLLTLALSVGAVHFRQRQLVDEPLLRRLGELEAVQSVQLEKNGNLVTVSVSLDYVDDLASTYYLLARETEKTLGKRKYHLEVVDRRDDLLASAYTVIHLALHEAVQRGNFTEMGRLVAETMRAAGVEEHKVVVTAGHICFQARRGDSYLYSVVERRRHGEEGERT